MLKLKRPLIFLDLETTGTDVAKDRIVEIAFVKMHESGEIETLPSQENQRYHHAKAQDKQLLNPCAFHHLDQRI